MILRDKLVGKIAVRGGVYYEIRGVIYAPRGIETNRVFALLLHNGTSYALFDMNSGWVRQLIESLAGVPVKYKAYIGTRQPVLMSVLNRLDLSLLVGGNMLSREVESWMNAAEFGVLTQPSSLFEIKGATSMAPQMQESELYPLGTLVHRVEKSNTLSPKPAKIIAHLQPIGKYKLACIGGDEIEEYHSNLVPAKESFDYIITNRPHYESLVDCGELFNRKDKFILINGFLYNKKASIAIEHKKYKQYFKEIKNDSVPEPSSTNK
jgi:hypothetical protein